MTETNLLEPPDWKNWKAPNRVLVIQDSTDRREAKVFRAHAAPNGVCDNLINALRLLANHQKDGDNPVNMDVQGFLKKSRFKIVDGLRRRIMVDNHEAVRVGDLGKNMESGKVVKPKYRLSGSSESGRS